MPALGPPQMRLDGELPLPHNMQPIHMDLGPLSTSLRLPAQGGQQ